MPRASATQHELARVELLAGLPGETLMKLSRQYHKSLSEIARANNIAPGTMVKVGDRIVIPGVHAQAAAPLVPPMPIAQQGKPATKVATAVSRSGKTGGGDALHTVHSRFVFQSGIDLVAFDQRYCFLEAADSCFRGVENFHLPALAFGIARVHAENVGREQGRFVTAGARSNFQDHILFIVGIAGNQKQFEVGIGLLKLGLQSFNLDPSQLAHLFVAAMFL